MPATEEAEYVIIGGGIAGTTAAETLRRNDAEGRIVIVSREPHRLYARLELSKAAAVIGETPETQLYLKTLQWYDEQRIALRSGVAAVALDAHEKTIALSDGTRLRYGKVLLALGSTPRRFAVPGAERDGVTAYRTLDDYRAIRRRLADAKRALCVGGGFISFEMAEAFRRAGLATTVLIREPSFWANVLDAEGGRIIEEALERNGVTIIREDEAVEVYGTAAVEGVRTANGRTIPADIVVAGIGVTVPAEFVAAAGGAVRRGIVVDETLRTNLPDVFAAGDCAEFYDGIVGEHVLIGNWTNAYLQGRAAAAAMLGERTPFRAVTTYTTSAFGLSIVFLGSPVTSPNRLVISRRRNDAPSYGRIIVKDGVIVGAVLINRTEELSALTTLMKERVPVAGKEEALRDPSFPLGELVRS